MNLGKSKGINSTSPRIGAYILVASFANLLKNEYLVEIFIDNKGMSM